MSNSPILSAEGPVECVIESGGKALSSILPIVSVDVYYGINSIPKAVIVIEDGALIAAVILSGRAHIGLYLTRIIPGNIVIHSIALKAHFLGCDHGG